MIRDSVSYQYRTINQHHHQQLALAYLGKLLAHTKGNFHFVAAEDAPIISPEQYLDTISSISSLLMNSGSVQNVAMDVYSQGRASKHNKLECILLPSSDKYFITPPMDAASDIYLFTVSLCPPLSYLWHIYLKLRRVGNHIGAPTYPPKFIKLYLSCTPLLKDGYVYESEPFPISNTDEPQCLSLPSHVPGALFAHVVLCGARQQSPEDGKYYVAIEHMSFNGVVAGNLAAIAMKTLEMSRVGIHMSRTSSVMVHGIMQRHVTNTCNILSRLNISCYRTLSSWILRKLELQEKDPAGISHLQFLNSLQKKEGQEDAQAQRTNINTVTITGAGTGTGTPMTQQTINPIQQSTHDNPCLTMPWAHKNMIISSMTNELLREDCNNSRHTCTSRYSANSLKWIENTLVYIAVEANQFKSRRSKDKMLLQSGQPYFIPKVEYNLAFTRRWNLNINS